MSTSIRDRYWPPGDWFQDLDRSAQGCYATPCNQQHRRRHHGCNPRAAKSGSAGNLPHRLYYSNSSHRARIDSIPPPLRPARKPMRIAASLTKSVRRTEKTGQSVVGQIRHMPVMSSLPGGVAVPPHVLNLKTRSDVRLSFREIWMKLAGPREAVCWTRCNQPSRRRAQDQN